MHIEAMQAVTLVVSIVGAVAALHARAIAAELKAWTLKEEVEAQRRQQERCNQCRTDIRYEIQQAIRAGAAGTGE